MTPGDQQSPEVHHQGRRHIIAVKRVEEGVAIIIIKQKKRKRRRRRIGEEEHAIKGVTEKSKIPCAGATGDYLLRSPISRRIFGQESIDGPRAHLLGVSPLLLLSRDGQWLDQNGGI